MKPRSRDAVSLLQGTVDLLILRAIQHEPAHGYAISRRVRERTDGVLAIEDAALYQALHRLEAREWIEADWGLSENNRRAKYDSLTAEGRRQLKAEVTSWKRYAQAVFKLIESSACGRGERAERVEPQRVGVGPHEHEKNDNPPSVPLLVTDDDRHPYRHSRRVPLSSRHADRGSDSGRAWRHPRRAPQAAREFGDAAAGARAAARLEAPRSSGSGGWRGSGRS